MAPLRVVQIDRRLGLGSANGYDMSLRFMEVMLVAGPLLLIAG